jgi:hypothetical protein
VPEIGPEAAESERRGQDRRNKPTPFLSRYSFLGGRRKHGGARGGEREGAFVDVYSFRLWVILSLVLTLNFLDSHFTLMYLARGGEEGNPIAVLLLGASMATFLIVKALGMGLGTALLCILKNFRNARLGVLFVLIGYQLLLLWHLLLYFRLGFFSRSL